jgi:adenylate kinase
VLFSIYLTGAPSTGKSTVARLLESRYSALRLSYGEVLTQRLADKVADQDELRRRSATVITAADVAAADEFVRDRVALARSQHISVVVDSHALTAETFGFRAIPYSAVQFAAIEFTHIACLFAPADTIRQRINADGGGRPLLEDSRFEMHAQLQSSLALSYAHSSGIPVAFIDATASLEAILSTILQFVGEVDG